MSGSLLNEAESVRLRIALASDEQLEAWLREGQGGHEFLWEVADHLADRRRIYALGQAQERRMSA
jgi:hypothetical protein